MTNRLKQKLPTDENGLLLNKSLRSLLPAFIKQNYFLIENLISFFSGYWKNSLLLWGLYLHKRDKTEAAFIFPCDDSECKISIL